MSRVHPPWKAPLKSFRKFIYTWVYEDVDNPFSADFIQYKTLLYNELPVYIRDVMQYPHILQITNSRTRLYILVNPQMTYIVDSQGFKDIVLKNRYILDNIEKLSIAVPNATTHLLHRLDTDEYIARITSATRTPTLKMRSIDNLIDTLMKNYNAVETESMKHSELYRFLSLVSFTANVSLSHNTVYEYIVSENNRLILKHPYIYWNIQIPVHEENNLFHHIAGQLDTLKYLNIDVSFNRMLNGYMHYQAVIPLHYPEPLEVLISIVKEIALEEAVKWLGRK